MNRHFKDTVYYLRRAGEHARIGIREELEPVEARIRAAIGREQEPEQGRVETIRSRVIEGAYQAKEEARAILADARARIRSARRVGEDEQRAGSA